MVTAAAIYARISSDPDDDRLGVSRQVEDCRALAEARGWPVADTYIDDDRSAYSGRRRPAYEGMLADLAEGRIDAVIVWHLDRLHRQPRELEAFFDTCDRAKVSSLATVTGDVNLATHDGRFHARILGAVARKESDDKSRRIRRRFEQMAESPDYVGPGGARPFGYLDDLRTPHPEEAPIVVESARRLLAGESLHGIARDLNDRGVRTSTGSAWSIQTLRRVLLNPRYAGLRKFRGAITGTGPQAAIISPDDAARLRAVLTDPARRTSRAPRRYLLTGGLMRCGKCGTAMIGRPNDRGVRRYECTSRPGWGGCGTVVAKAAPIEEWVAEAVIYRLDSPAMLDAMRGGATAPADDAAARLDEDRATLDALAAAMGRGEIGWTEWLAARKPIEARIEATRRAIARANKAAAVADYVGDSSALRERWRSLPLDRQRAIVAAVLDRIEVAPASVRGRRSFDPDRFSPVWRV